MKPVLVPTTDVNSETGVLLAWHAGDRSEVQAGETIAETEHLMRQAIALHLAGLAEDGDPLPEPRGPGVYVSRGSPAAA